MSTKRADCQCEASFTCGVCLRNAAPGHFTPSTNQEVMARQIAASNPFRNRAAESMGGQSVDFRRTSGGVLCKTCGLEYRRHPDSEHLDWNGNPFLKRLCDGDLVKL